MTTEYPGTGDPARSLALLWRDRARPAKAGRSGLTVDKIVAAAIELADAEGLTALSMRRVADQLGVGAMSLYTHIPGKAELIDLMLDTVIGETVVTDPDGKPPTRQPADPAGWRARLEAVARANLALTVAHPWMLNVAISRPTLGPNIMAKYEQDLWAIEGIGLTDLEMDSVITLIADFVHGAARGAVDASRAEAQTGMSDEQWWTTYAPLLEQVMDSSRYPLAGRVGSASGEANNAPSNPAQAFEFGLQRVLDGIELLINRGASA
jgi:AcrR family transcriptional regulator